MLRPTLLRSRRWTGFASVAATGAFISACAAAGGASHATTTATSVVGASGTPQTASATAMITPAPPPIASATPTPLSQPAVPKRLVVLLGDSLFYSDGLPDNQDFASVMSGDRKDLQVIDLGVPGDQTHDVLDRVRNATDSHADTVVVWIGTNDALAGVAPSTYSDELNQLLDLLAPAHEVLVTPIADLSAPAAYLPYAAIARDHAKTRGIPLVDLDGVITTGDYLEDGAHLNADAVKRVARLIEGLVPPD